MKLESTFKKLLISYGQSLFDYGCGELQTQGFVSDPERKERKIGEEAQITITNYVYITAINEPFVCFFFA